MNKLPIIIATEDDILHALMTAITLWMWRDRLKGYDMSRVQILLIPKPAGSGSGESPCKNTPHFLPLFAGNRENTRRLADFLASIETFMLLERDTGIYAIDPSVYPVMQREKAFLSSPLGIDPTLIAAPNARAQLGQQYRDHYLYYFGLFLTLAPVRIAAELSKRLLQAHDHIQVFKLKPDAKLMATPSGFAIETTTQAAELGAAIVASGINTLDIVDALAKKTTSQDFWVLRRERPHDGLPAGTFIYHIAATVSDRAKIQIVNGCPVRAARQIEELVQAMPPVVPATALVDRSGGALAAATALSPNPATAYRLRAKLVVDGVAIPRVFAMTDVPVICAYLTDMARQIAFRDRIFEIVADKTWALQWSQALGKTPSLELLDGTERQTSVQVLANTCLGCPHNEK